METTEIELLISQKLPNSTVRCSGDGYHFELLVIWSGFSDKNTVQRQQIIYQHIGEFIKNGSIHALSIKAFTQEEWDHKAS